MARRRTQIARGRKRKPNLPTQTRNLRSKTIPASSKDDSFQSQPETQASSPSNADIEVVPKQQQEVTSKQKANDYTRKLIVDDFINPRQSVVFSTLSLMPHVTALISFTRSIFGIYENRITKGQVIADNDCDILLNFVINKCLKQITLTIDGRKTYNQKFLNFTASNGSNITIYLDSVLKLMKKKNAGWIDDSLLDLFSDVINLLIGAHSQFQTEPLPSVCCMKQWQLEHLWCLSSLSEHHPTLDLNDPGFAMKLREAIIDGHLKNTFSNILQMYQQRTNIEDFPLTKIFAIINIPNQHYIQTTIDMIERKVTTRDSKTSTIDAAVYRRKWIAKVASICEHYVSDNQTNKQIYLGNQDMKKSTFYPSDINDIHMEHNIKSFTFSFYHNEAKENLFYPRQKDGINCGIYSAWYHLLTIFQDGDVCALNPNEWRKQMLLFIVVLHLYNEKLEDSSYFFPELFDFKTWLLSDCIPSELSNVFQKLYGEAISNKSDKNNNTNTSNDNVDDRKKPSTDGNKKQNTDGSKKPVTTAERNKLLEINELFMKCYGMHDFGVAVRNAYLNSKYHFVNLELDSLVEDSGWFPDSLRDILGCRGFDVNVNVQWKLQTKDKLRDKFYTFLRSVFNQAKDDKKGIRYVLNKSTTILLSIQLKNNLDKSKKDPFVLCCAAMQPIFDKTLFKGLYLDYIGTSNANPRDTITDYDNTVFTGKGFGKFMINVMQVIAWAISPKDKLTTKIVLKAADGLKSFYTNIGFKEINENHSVGTNFMQYPSLQRHLKSFPTDVGLKPYILEDFAEIDLLKEYFINHVYQPLSSVPMNTRFESPIDTGMHKVFQDEQLHKKTILLQESVEHENGAFIVPIGEAMTYMFTNMKPKEFSLYSGLYEYLIKQITWKVEVSRQIKKKTSRSSYDDLSNITGEISIRCGLCKYCHPTTFTMSVKDDEDDNDDDANVRAQVLAILEFFFDEHYNVGNLLDTKCSPCDKIQVKVLKRIRDKEMMFVGYHSHLQDGNSEMFKKLVLLFLQTHLERSNILTYFDWKSFRKTKYARRSKMMSMQVKENEMVNAVLGTNEKKLSQLKKQKDIERIKNNKLKKNANAWTNLWDDMVFLKHLRYVMYVDRNNCTVNQMNTILNKVKNVDAYNEQDKGFYVGFPSTNEQQMDNEETEDDNDDDGTQTSSLSHLNSIQQMGKIRFIDWKWIRDTLDRPTIKHMRKEPLRQFQLPKHTLDKIKDGMKTLQYKKITHIYKFICPTTYEFKFWNAICKRSSKQFKGQQVNFEYIEGDEVKKDWLYFNAVTINNCKQWYDTVMDTNTTNMFYELPIAAVASGNLQLPLRVIGCPVLKYPQNNLGVCGVSAFSSAFYYAYSEPLSLLIHQERDNYLKALTKPMKTKKSQALKFLSAIIQQKPFKGYYIRRMKRINSWKQMLESANYYYTIMLCIPKTTNFSRDHIIGITQGWIFDGNLPYAIPLNEDNLSWCSSHGQSGEVFTGFCEQIQVCVKEEKKKQTTK